MRSLILGIAACVACSWTVGSMGGEPVTVAEAAKLLDLRELPFAGKIREEQHRTIAQAFYETESSISDAYKQLTEQLAKRGWKPLPDGTVTDQYASATYANGDALLSLSIMPGTKPELCRVTLNQHGNRILADLPLPDGATEQFSSPIMKMLNCPASVDATTKDLDGKLRAAGWTAYGIAGPQRFYKKNAVKLTTFVSEAPAQNNQTMLQLTTELMSADLPAPEEADQVQYSDSPTQVTFRDPREVREMLKTYQPQLLALGWKPTTEHPIIDGFEQFLILRTDAGEMLELNMRPIGDEGTRVVVRYRTLEEVKRMEEAAAKAGSK